MKVEGVKGAVKVGPHEAASFTSWSLVSDADAPGTYLFTAHVRAVDPFWITQEPQELCVQVGPSTFRWRGISVSVAGARLTAVVPRPEVRT